MLSFKSLLATLCLTVTVAWTSPAAAADPPDALATFSDLHGQVLGMIDTKASDTDLQAKVDDLLQYEWIFQASLGGPKRFEKKCAPRCDEFKGLLTQLIRRNYIKHLRNSKNGTVAILGQTVRKTATKVSTEVRFKKNGQDQKLEVDYIMREIDGDWVVVDIITDGVSLVRTYKFDFGKILRTGGIDELISRLNTKLADIAKAD